MDVALNATGLGGAFGPNDQLLLFNNAVVALNKTPSATYTYDTHWRLSGDATLADRGGDIIPSGTGFIVRKIGGSDLFWNNSFPVTAISAVSRKSHGSAPGSPFDIPLPLTGNPGVECRIPGSTPAGVGVDYQIVFTFPTAVTINTATGTQGASVTSGIGSIVSTTGSSTTGATTVTVNLNGVTNQQRITLTLLGVNDGTNSNDVAVRIGLLLGDTNGNSAVNNSDITQTKGQSGIVANATNFRTDVNVNGVINNSDITTVKGKSGTGLPAGP